MAAYLIIDLDVHEAEEYRASGYGDAVADLVAQHGGRYLAAGGTHEVLEGDWEPTRLGLIEFPSMADLMAFRQSPDYQPWLQVRHQNANSSIVALEGV